MAKTQEELNILKKDLENLNNKLSELSDEELKAVAGGAKSNLNIQILTALPLFEAFLGVNGMSSSITTSPAEAMTLEALRNKVNPASKNR